MITSISNGNYGISVNSWGFFKYENMYNRFELWITIFVGKPNRYLMNNALNKKASWGMLEHQYEYAYNGISGNYLFHFAFLIF